MGGERGEGEGLEGGRGEGRGQGRGRGAGVSATTNKKSVQSVLMHSSLLPCGKHNEQ